MDTVGNLPTLAAERWGDKTFAISGDDSLSFTSLRDWGDAIGSRLLAAGVQAGERVMILLPNRLEALVLVAASWRIAAIPVPVVAIYRTHELRYILADMRPAVVVTQAVLGDRDLAQEVDACLEEAGVAPRVKYLLDGADRDGWEALPGRHAEVVDHDPWPEYASDQVEALRLYTSGTTSNPKGAMLNSRTIIASALQFHEVIGIGESDVGVALAPVTHLAGLLSAFLVPLTTGASATVLPRWDVTKAVELIDRYQGTFAFGAMVFLKDLVEHYEAHGTEGRHVLLRFISGGASTPPALVYRAEQLGLHAIRSYGMTETAGAVTLSSAEAPVDRRANWDGQMLDGLEVQILDDNGEPVGPGVSGTIRMRGDRVMLGYSAPEANVGNVVDGWFYPGDVGMLSEDGWLRITGRTKDIINRGGEKFSAADIEGAISRHPAVGTVAVIGVPDERLGESIGAYLIVRPGFDAPSGEELSAFLIDDLGMAKAKVPTSWFVVDTIPMSASGKIQKHLLRALHV